MIRSEYIQVIVNKQIDTQKILNYGNQRRGRI